MDVRTMTKPQLRERLTDLLTKEVTVAILDQRNPVSATEAEAMADRIVRHVILPRLLRSDTSSNESPESTS